jgi:hypothetical protein
MFVRDAVHPSERFMTAKKRERVNRTLEFELGARFEGACGLAWVLAPSQMREHVIGPFGRADLHPCHKLELCASW